jgi:hypothetical protein
MLLSSKLNLRAFLAKIDHPKLSNSLFLRNSGRETGSHFCATCSSDIVALAGLHVFLTSGLREIKIIERQFSVNRVSGRGSRRILPAPLRHNNLAAYR